MTPAIVAAWLAVVEGVVGLWERMTGRYPKPKDPPAPPGQPAAPRRRRVWGGGPPATAAAVLGLLAASVAGCAGPLSGLSKQELVELCEAVAPCEAEEPDCSACPSCPETPPAPAPGPDPGPPPPGDGGTPPVTQPPGPATGDAIDLKSVEWGDPSPAMFPVTATLAPPAVSKDHRKISLRFTLPGTWAVEAGKVHGNVWVCGEVKRPGRWACGTFEWIPLRWAGEGVSVLEWRDDDPPFIQANGAVSKWRPVRGDRIVFGISSMVRGGKVRQPTGRSPWVETRWP